MSVIMSGAHMMCVLISRAKCDTADDMTGILVSIMDQ